jgi:NAD(P)-dependent dehydrogenase (short-subunit alcohol dehydrogenase family)
MARGRYDLNGKTVLITGASRGIGAEAARQLAGRGARLSLAGLEPELLAEVAGSLPEAAWFEADVTDMDQVEEAVAGTIERFGGIDVVIANAGIGPPATLETIDLDLFHRTIDVNLLGVWRTVRATLPHVIERRGYVLVVASLAAVLQSPLLGHYAAAKAGAEALANTLRAEMAEHGVKVGVAYFGFIDTEMVSAALEHPGASLMRKEIGGPLSRVYPVSDAGRAIARGVERRSRHVVHPPWARTLMVLRGVIQPLIEWGSLRMGADEAVRRTNAEARRAGAGQVDRVG